MAVYAAVLTPLDESFEPRVDLFVKHCRFLLANGCDGLAPLGTTGEANSLSVVQRIRLIEEAAAAGLPMDKSFWGAGSCALAEAVHVTSSAVAVGASGVLLLPPFYYKNPTEDGLFAFFSEVIQRVADSRLKLYLYHFPQLSTVPITVQLLARLIHAYGQTIAGVKDSGGDWNYTARLTTEFPSLNILSGSEEFLLDNLRAGGGGCISATVNVTAPLAALVARTRSDDLQRELTEVRIAIQQYPLQAALKHIAAKMTGKTSWRNILPPNQPLTNNQASQLMSRIDALPQMKIARDAFATYSSY